MTEHTREVAAGARFEFGANWRRFLLVLDEDRIAEAEKSLRSMLEVERLDGLRFLDVGSGSGLFSLAARRLGAAVRSFDYDLQSVACTAELRRRYFPDDPQWTVQAGSVLDPVYLASVGQFDIVYSWGVLHHTGDMWQALANVGPLVREGGSLFIAIYNDQGPWSRLYAHIKKAYVRSPYLIKWLILSAFAAYSIARGLAADLFLYRRPPFQRYWNYRRSRGMSVWHDWVDWIGGYPFEVARPEQIFDLFRKQGFMLKRLRTCGGGLGNNEFVFEKQRGQ